MAAVKVQKSGNVFADIAGWSQELPAWQQDGLRRIIEVSLLSSQDIDELTQLCKKEHGSSDSVLTARPLDQDTIPKGSVAAQAVTLRSIGEAEHVNALDGEQELTFGETGLTIIFGYNGSGKSGYGRILRRACRSREKGPAILANVLDGTAVGPASAVITYACDGIEQNPAQWIDEQRAVDPLGSVSFFDSQCAAIHVGEKNSIAFTPFGLDVLPKLGAACKEVQTRLDSERNQLEAIRPRFLQSPIAIGNTAVGKLLKALSHESSIEGLELLASLTEGERQRAQELTVILANDGRKLGEELRNRARRLLALKGILTTALTALSAKSVELLRLLAADYRTKATAADTAAQISFTNDPLSGIGEPVWRELWEAARRYSAQAYPHREFPVVDGDNTVCVLCQQPLTEDGKDRLSRFETFVANDTAKGAAKAKAILSEAVQRLELLGLTEKSLKERLVDLGLVSPDALSNTRNVLATLIRQLRAIKHAYRNGDWGLAGRTSPADTTSAIQQLIDGLIAQAGEVERTVDTGERQKLASELAELKARDWLASVFGDVKEHITRLHDVHKLKNCIDNTKTNKITAKSKALATAHVTDQLRNAFAAEIQRMRQGVKRLNVELNAVAGEYGSSYYRIQLVGARNAKIGGIVSEGEHRCIALAGFLAELATEASKSAVVFDDPVTSLDHQWRECFAHRLAEEAIHRQIIVFTHDIVFLHDLNTFAERQKMPATLRRIQAGQPHCGHVSDGLPWIAQKTRSRIDALEKAARATRPEFDAQNDDKYERDICGVYSDLRATVERAVEECFFRGIVLRHRDYINIDNLKLVTVVTQDHCDRAQNLFQRCCDVTDAHDRAMLRNFGVPTPDDALSDIGKLLALINELRPLQNAMAKANG